MLIDDMAKEFNTLFVQKVCAFENAQNKVYREITEFFQKNFGHRFINAVDAYYKENGTRLTVPIICDETDDKKGFLIMEKTKDHTDTLRVELLDSAHNLIYHLFIDGSDTEYVKYSQPKNLADFEKKVDAFERDKKLFQYIQTYQDDITNCINKYMKESIQKKMDRLNKLSF